MVCQTNPKACRFVMASALVLENVLLGKSLKEALELMVEAAMSSKFSLDDADVGNSCIHLLMEAKMKDLPELMQDLGEDQGGSSAQFPSPFVVSVFSFYKAIADGDITEETYIKTIRANIMAGGDTCCRAIYMGAVLGAAAGSVPQSFVDKFSKDAMEKVDRASVAILEVIN